MNLDLAPDTPRFFHASDGARLAWREIGEGRPLVLLHGLFSNADINWIKFGHAALLADAGFRVIMPDLRAHGDSAAPHDAAAYPKDILASDGLGLIAHLDLTDYDLGGYSLGGRTAVRMALSGATPTRLVIAGMGLEGITDTGGRAAHFRHVLAGRGTHERGSDAWMAEAFLKTTGGDAEALMPLLDSFVDTQPQMLSTLAMPTLVVGGADDADNGSRDALATVLPFGHLVTIPGNHMSSVTKRELGMAIAAFLDGPPLVVSVSEPAA